MKATVIINTYKEKPEYLMQTINAFLNQVGVKMEIIISTVDNDPSIMFTVNNYNLYDNVKLCISPKPGIYSQLNNAMKQATEDWITVMSGNDVPVTDKVLTEIETCIKFKKKVCYSSIIICDENLNVKGTGHFYEYDIEKHLVGNFVNDGAIFHKSLLKYLPFQWKRWKNHSFYDFWLRVYEAEGNVFAYNPQGAFFYRQSTDSQHLKRKQDRKKYMANRKLREELQEHHRKIIVEKYEKMLK